MFSVTTQNYARELRCGWSSSVDDYAISGGWALGGDLLLVLNAAGGIAAFNGKSGDLMWHKHNIHQNGGLATAVHPEGQLFATAGQDGRVLVWDVSKGCIILEINVAGSWVDNVAWSMNGRWLAISCNKQVFVYNSNGSEIWRSDDHNSTVSTIAWSGKEELVTACYGTVTFFDGTTGDPNQKLSWKGSLVSMVLSPDGEVVACGSQDNSVHFWRRSTENDSMMSGYAGKPSALTFDSTGTLLATGGGKEVTVWNFQGDGPEGTAPQHLTHHSQSLTSLMFSNRSMKLASGSRDGAVAIWNLSSDREAEKFGASSLKASIAELYWRPDYRALAALDAKGGVTVWRI